MREHRILYKEQGTKYWQEDTRRFWSRAAARIGTSWYFRQPRSFKVKIRSYKV